MRLATGVSKITYSGQGTKEVTLDISFGFTWEGFNTTTVKVVKKWVGFGATLNNKVVWTRNCRLIFEGVEESEFLAKQVQYEQMRITAWSSWTDENGSTVVEPPPRGGYYNSGTNPSITSGVNMAKTTQFITKQHLGSAKAQWEF